MVLSTSPNLASNALHLHQQATNAAAAAAAASTLQQQPGQFQRLKVEDALSYLDQVRDTIFH